MTQTQCSNAYLWLGVTKILSDDGMSASTINRVSTSLMQTTLLGFKLQCITLAKLSSPQSELPRQLQWSTHAKPTITARWQASTHRASSQYFTRALKLFWVASFTLPELLPTEWPLEEDYLGGGTKYPYIRLNFLQHTNKIRALKRGIFSTPSSLSPPGQVSTHLICSYLSFLCCLPFEQKHQLITIIPGNMDN